MQIVFQSSIRTGNPFLLTPAIALILVTAMLCLCSKKPFWKKHRKKIGWIYIVLLLTTLWIGGTQILTYQNVVIAYQRGHYDTLDGKVECYVAPATKLNPYESFSVNGVLFSYGGGEGRNYFGYDKTALEGGFITGNGQSVRLGYLTYDGKNIIVQLEIER